MGLIQRVRKRLKRKAVAWQRERFEHNAPQTELRRLLAASKKVLDLGCGANPVEGATAAVDLFVDPRQRDNGNGARIDISTIEKRGIRFVNQSIDSPLPFASAEFEFAHCSHVIEHVESPGAACDEMMRVASQGLLRCPAAMLEYLTGRPYHRWMVMQRASRIVFIEKSAEDFAVFGKGAGNAFESLLDWEGEGPATPDRGEIGKLKRRLQELFYGRAPQSEVNLFWHAGFFWTEVRANGTAKSGGRAGSQWWFDESGARRESA